MAGLARPTPSPCRRRPKRSKRWCNLHSTFTLDDAEVADLEHLDAATADLFRHAVQLGGTVSGEHGIGFLKNGQLRHQWPPRAILMHNEIKRTFDPKSLLIPGKKLP